MPDTRTSGHLWAPAGPLSLSHLSCKGERGDRRGWRQPPELYDRRVEPRWALAEVPLAAIPSTPASSDNTNKGVTNVYPFPALDGGGWFQDWDKPKRPPLKHSPETLATLLEQQRDGLRAEWAKLEKRVADFNALPPVDRLRHELAYLKELLAATTDRRRRRDIERRIDEVRTEIWRLGLQ